MAAPVVAKAASGFLKKFLFSYATNEEQRKKSNKLVIYITVGMLIFFHFFAILYIIIVSFSTSFLGSAIISIADFFTTTDIQSYVDELLAYEIFPEPIQQEQFGLLTMPCVGYEDKRNMTAPFGYSDQYLSGVYHTGMDFANDPYSPVTCVFDGVVSYIGYKAGYGRMVIVDHGGGFETYYSHLSNTHVMYGQTVEVGTVVGYQGGDPDKDSLVGTSTGSHLHFEIRHNNWSVDPDRFLFVDKWDLAKDIFERHKNNLLAGNGITSLGPEDDLIQKLLIWGKLYSIVYNPNGSITISTGDLSYTSGGNNNSNTAAVSLN